MSRSRILLVLASMLGLLILLQPPALATQITVFVTVVSPEDGSEVTDVPEDDLGVSWASGAYSNNLDMMQKLEIPQAAALEVTVIGQTEVGYDWIHRYDVEGQEIRRLCGRIDTRFAVPGSFIWVRFVTDDSVTDQGVIVSVRPAGTN